MNKIELRKFNEYLDRIINETKTEDCYIIQCKYPGERWEDVSTYVKKDTSYKDVQADYKEYIASKDGCQYRIISRREPVNESMKIRRIINEDVLKRVKDKKDAIKLKEEEDRKNSYNNLLDEVIQKLKKEDYLNKRFKKLNIEVNDIFEQGKGDYLMELYDSNNKAGVLLFINIVKGRIDFYLMLVDDYINDDERNLYIDQEERIMEEIFGLSFDDMRQEDDFDKIIKIIERFFGQAKAKEVEKKLDDFFEDNYDEIVKEVEKSKNESRNLRRNESDEDELVDYYKNHLDEFLNDYYFDNAELQDEFDSDLLITNKEKLFDEWVKCLNYHDEYTAAEHSARKVLKNNESRKIRRKSEKHLSDYEFVEGIIYNVLGDIGEEDGQFKLYVDNVSAKVYSIKDGKWDKTIAQARNLKELMACLESIRLYKDFKGIK